MPDSDKSPHHDHVNVPPLEGRVELKNGGNFSEFGMIGFFDRIKIKS